MSAYRFVSKRTLAEMDAICAWLKANDITPGDVPLDAKVVIEGGRLTVDVHLRNANGRKYVDPKTGEVASGTRTVQLKQPPPNFRSLMPLGRSADG